MEFIRNIINKINEWLGNTGLAYIGWIIAAIVFFLFGYTHFATAALTVWLVKNWSVLSDWAKSNDDEKLDVE